MGEETIWMNFSTRTLTSLTHWFPEAQATRPNDCLQVVFECPEIEANRESRSKYA
jgi:hypothetical protein